MADENKEEAQKVLDGVPSEYVDQVVEAQKAPLFPFDNTGLNENIVDAVAATEPERLKGSQVDGFVQDPDKGGDSPSGVDLSMVTNPDVNEDGAHPSIDVKGLGEPNIEYTNKIEEPESGVAAAGAEAHVEVDSDDDNE